MTAMLVYQNEAFDTSSDPFAEKSIVLCFRKMKYRIFLISVKAYPFSCTPKDKDMHVAPVTY